MKSVPKSKCPEWYYDEKRHSGINYSDQKNVDRFDDEHTKFRDYAQEAKRIIELAGIQKNDILLDAGCGSGALTLHLAKKASKVIAIDVSGAMIELCKKKIAAENISNIRLVNAGFLDYKHDGEKVDVIVSSLALHHLPDFWKFIALRKMNGILKKGGKFYLADVVFSVPPDGYDDSINDWIVSLGEIAGGNMREEAVTHVKEEYSTLDWIMERMLDNAGFRLEKISKLDQNLYGYLCVKR